MDVCLHKLSGNLARNNLEELYQLNRETKIVILYGVANTQVNQKFSVFYSNITLTADNNFQKSEEQCYETLIIRVNIIYLTFRILDCDYDSLRYHRLRKHPLFLMFRGIISFHTK